MEHESQPIIYPFAIPLTSPASIFASPGVRCLFNMFLFWNQVIEKQQRWGCPGGVIGSWERLGTAQQGETLAKHRPEPRARGHCAGGCWAGGDV